MPDWIDGGLLWGLLIGLGGALVALGRWVERWTRSGTRLQDLESANPGQRLDDIERRIDRLEGMVDRLIWRGGAVRLGPREEASRDGS